MRVFTITIAYAPAALVARSLILYQKYRAVKPYRHILVQGHYPINRTKNTNDIRLIATCFPEIEIWDPGSNMGSAQSQNWALQRLDLQKDDVFINLDPDSACTHHGWDKTMKVFLEQNDGCALISCMAPMVQRYMKARGEVCGHTGIHVARNPTPFNLSMWRYSFLKEIGGVPQMGLWWGETEGPFFTACQQRGKYHAYLLDYLENEDGKWMQDRQQAEWKDLHCRTAPPNQFLGNLEEYLRWKHPSLVEMDTCRDLTDSNFP